MLFTDPHVFALAKRIHALSDDLKLIEQLRAPSIRDIVGAPTIDGWSMGHRLEPALLGTVQGHPHIARGAIVTSGLYYLDEKAGYARTLSRWYHLGDKAEGP